MCHLHSKITHTYLKVVAASQNRGDAVTWQWHAVRVSITDLKFFEMSEVSTVQQTVHV